MDFLCPSAESASLYITLSAKTLHLAPVFAISSGSSYEEMLKRMDESTEPFGRPLGTFELKSKPHLLGLGMYGRTEEECPL